MYLLCVFSQVLIAFDRKFDLVRPTFWRHLTAIPATPERRRPSLRPGPIALRTPSKSLLPGAPILSRFGLIDPLIDSRRQGPNEEDRHHEHQGHPSAPSRPGLGASVSAGTVSNALERAQAADLSWPPGDGRRRWACARRAVRAKQQQSRRLNRYAGVEVRCVARLRIPAANPIRR